jgi:hypothetical protein
MKLFRQAQVGQVLQRLTDGVVKGGPNLADQAALPVGPGAVAEQHHGYSVLQVDPKGAAAKPKVPYGLL